MAISNAMRAALRALSYSQDEIGLKKSYKLARRIKTAAGRGPLFYKPWDHVITAEDHEIPVRIFAPETRGLHDILLFFHGGGWVTGNIDSYSRVCYHMSHLTNRIVISVDYRLAPEYKFPAAPEDCYTVAREVYRHPEWFGVMPERIALIGDSAGANLAAAVSLMARDRGEFLPSQQILLYPATYYDHTESAPFESIRENGTDYLLTSKRICEYMELYQNSEADQHNPYFAPLVAEDLSCQPKTLIITAQYDPLRDEGEAYADRLRAGGNQVQMHRIPEALHGFFSLPARFPQVRCAYGMINRFLRGPDPLQSVRRIGE